MGYFDRTEFVSNSELGSLNKVLRQEAEVKSLQKIYAFGSLIDAHLTEPGLVKHYEELVEDEPLLIKAKMMKQAGEADLVLKRWLDNSKKQHEVYRNKFAVNFEGLQFEIPLRIKLDFLKKSIKTGADLKSTACKKQEDFLDALLHFDYDRQAALYMDAARLDKFLFIGISKTENKRTGKHLVFKYAINRNDHLYNSGLRKYSYLAFKYKTLIQGVV